MIFALNKWQQVTHLAKHTKIKLQMVMKPEFYMESFPKPGFSRIKRLKKIKIKSSQTKNPSQWNPSTHF